MARRKQRTEPRNHFGKSIFDFLLRTDSTLEQLSASGEISREQLRLYIFYQIHPQIRNFMKIVNGMSQITGLPKSMMINRLHDALNKDFDNLPYPPKPRKFEE